MAVLPLHPLQVGSPVCSGKKGSIRSAWESVHGFDYQKYNKEIIAYEAQHAQVRSNGYIALHRVPQFCRDQQ